MENFKKFKTYFLWSLIAAFIGVSVPFSFLQILKLAARGYFTNKGVEYAANLKFIAPALVSENIATNDGDEQKINLLFAGDIMLDRGVESSILKNGNGDFSFIFSKADFLKKADIVFANLEGPISDKGQDAGNTYSFRFRVDVADALRQAGFDVLSLANNHMADWGKEAFEDTFGWLERSGVIGIGAGRNKKEASEVKILESNGLKIGFLAFSDVGPNWLGATASSSGVLLASVQNFDEIIKNASEKTDALAVSFHFGKEYQKVSNARQKYLARRAIDNGAKIVVGHHPHVAQEIEKYKDGVIAYSLGNFIFDQYFSEDTMSGMVLEIELEGKEIKSVVPKTVKLNKFFQPELIQNQ